MSTWKKHFTALPKSEKLKRALKQSSSLPEESYTSGAKYSSYLPEVYAGQPNRLERYAQFDQMDMDSEVNSSLNIIADTCTQINDNEDTPFSVKYLKDNVTETEVDIIQSSLRQWTFMNDFKTRIWRMFRNTIKYGDQFFIRDPETFKWFWVDHNKVDSVIVNEAEGKKIEQYTINDMDLNLQTLVATKLSNRMSSQPFNYTNPSRIGDSSKVGGYGSPSNYVKSSTGNQGINGTAGISGDNVVHLSMSEGLDSNWPFGISILENIFKTFKQKELLEDSIIIYRVQRAPERRVFYIDTGGMPVHKAASYVERIKNEIHQRRIPNRTGGGNSILDAAYNPLSIIEDYFLATTPEGRGSKIETLPGGESLGEIDDLKYFDNKMKRGLGVPSSYLPTGPEDGQAQYSDGRVGTAYIQEYRFTKYCERLQRIVIKVFDDEFKLYLKQRGMNVDSSLFELNFNSPQNFSKYRQMELDSQMINIFQPLSTVPHLSKRFVMMRYLGLSEEELLENERLWKEENPDAIAEALPPEQEPGLTDVGVRASNEIPGEDNTPFDETPPPEEGTASPISGDEGEV